MPGRVPLHHAGAPLSPFEANADRRHRIPKQRHRVTNWAEYDAALRARGSLTVWFSEEAVAAWRAAPRATQGRQPSFSALAIATTLTLRAVFRLALRRTERLIGSVIALLGLDLPVPRPASGPSGEPVHLLVDSTGLRLHGPGEWLTEKHGTTRRRSWRKLHLATDADTGRIVASALTDKDADDGSQVGPLLEQVDGPVASFTADGAFDRDDVYAEVAARHPDADVIVPPRSSAVPSGTVETAPTRRDRHLRAIAERGRLGWQKASGYGWRALLESDISRFKRVIGDGLRSRTDGRQETEVAIAAEQLARPPAAVAPRQRAAGRAGRGLRPAQPRARLGARRSGGRVHRRRHCQVDGFGGNVPAGRSWRDAVRIRHPPRLPLPGGGHRPRGAALPRLRPEPAPSTCLG